MKNLLRMLRREAHESNDDSLIAHCPFCGSGKIYGRSDNTVVCEYCDTTFKVKVQPADPFMPQTDPLTGEPIAVRPMDEPPAGVPAQVPQPAPPAPAAPTDELQPVTFAAARRYYLTPDGTALDEDRYIRYLAYHHADNPHAQAS